MRYSLMIHAFSIGTDSFFYCTFNIFRIYSFTTITSSLVKSFKLDKDILLSTHRVEGINKNKRLHTKPGAFMCRGCYLTAIEISCAVAQQLREILCVFFLYFICRFLLQIGV